MSIEMEKNQINGIWTTVQRFSWGKFKKILEIEFLHEERCTVVHLLPMPFAISMDIYNELSESPQYYVLSLKIISPDPTYTSYQHIILYHIIKIWE